MEPVSAENVFNRGSIQSQAASLSAGENAGANPASGEATTGDALVTSEQAQTIIEKPSIGAQGSGSDPLSQTESGDAEESGTEEAPESEQTDTEVKFDEEGVPTADTDLVKVREWGAGLNKDLKAIRPIADKVVQMGGIQKLEAANSLYDALANPQFQPNDILTALQQMSPQRYTQMIETAFTNHQDVFLKALGLNPRQFEIAARAVMEGRPIGADDLNAANVEIPFGISDDVWYEMPETEQQKLLATQKQQLQAQEQLQKAQEAERTRQIQEAQDAWTTDLDGVIASASDKFNIPKEGEGSKLRDRVRRNVWAALSSDESVAPMFYEALNNFRNGEIQFANAKLEALRKYVGETVVQELEYYTKAERLQSELDGKKLSRAGDRKEINSSDQLETMSIKKGSEAINGSLPLDKLFDRGSIQEAAKSIARR